MQHTHHAMSETRSSHESAPGVHIEVPYPKSILLAARVFEIAT